MTDPAAAQIPPAVDAWLDGIATEADFAALDAWLAADSAHARLLLDLSVVHHGAAVALKHPAAKPIKKPQPTAQLSAAGAPIYLKGREPKPTPFIIYPIAIAAAALLTAAIVVVYLLTFTTEPKPDPINPDRLGSPGPTVATLIENTGDLRTPHGFPAEGDSYGRGEYTLDRGTAEFMLTNAVNVKLNGQTRMSMHNDMHVSLTRGSAAFVVPKDATGFTVHLPDRSKVVDLGTAFRVEVDDDGESKLHVAQGEVEWVSEDPSVDPMRLEAGAVVRIARGQATLLKQSSIIAGLVHEGLSVHYRASDVDGFGAPGDEATNELANLADPDRHAGVLVNATGIVRNTDHFGTPFEYGIVLNADKQTHIKTDYQIAGGVDKVTDATWEFWLRADRTGAGTAEGRGALYGEFNAHGNSRHFVRLQDIGTDSGRVNYDEWPADIRQGVWSDPPLFETNTFTQIVVTKRGDTMTFYRDGRAVGNTHTSSERFVGKTITDTLFGMRQGYGECFDGQFNIIRVYDTALTAKQIRANYQAEHAATTQDGDDAETQSNPLTSESETADR